ncbi:MAG: alkaline phosphatase family protein [Desulfobacterales bacterium]|jgi:predicted AlkP superfamily pyrophosphatase or phosphodiesterase
MHQTTHKKENLGVILIVLDGCRPDGITNAQTPTLDWVMANGARHLKARTTFPTISFPCHLSMLYGVKPHRIGIYGNYSAQIKMNCHHSILDLAHMCGRKVAALYDWEQLRELSSPTALDFVYYRRASIDKYASITIASECAKYIETEKPGLCFLNLGTIDTVGHAQGWMSEAYLNQIGFLDEAVGILIENMKTADLLNSYHILILADHGGIGRDHGGQTDEEMNIPWMIIGPGIKCGYEIVAEVSICDTAPTVAHLLQLPIQGAWQGKVVTEIFSANRCNDL